MFVDIVKELRRSRQALPTERLCSIAAAAGFDVRKGRKHIRCAHSTYPDIHVGIVSGDTTAISKLRLADAMEEIAFRERRKDDCAKAFHVSASENRLTAIREKLPPYITAELTPNGNVVLRDRQIPQIGVTLRSPGEDRLIENRIHNEMEPMKRDIYVQLKRLQSEQDAIAHFDDNGTFTGHVSHEIYGDDFDVDFPVYQEGGNIADLYRALNDYKDGITLKDFEQSERKDTLLKRPFLGRVLISHSDQRGERTHHVQAALPGGHKLMLSFNSFSHARVTTADRNKDTGEVTAVHIHDGRFSDETLDALAAQIERTERRIAALNDRWASYRVA